MNQILSSLAMATLGFQLSVLLLAVFLLTVPVRCDEKDNLLQGINSYRRTKGLPELTKNDKAGCLADQIAEKMEGQPCARVTGSNSTPPSPPNPPQFSNYPDALKKCKVDIAHTKDGVILPVCVKDRVPTLVLTNYTQSSYGVYLNNSKFTGAGIGKEEDWTVVVMSTNTPSGTLSSGSVYSNVCIMCHMFFLLVSLLILVI
ncbi:putative GPI-anchored protein At3g06035 [Apium graveolens]|uniref:putative GPI-anchored protein At3g06035 n=1 Tax=Apium graveolens TaxID=4045 RepID=UPI003D7BD2AE